MLRVIWRIFFGLCVRGFSGSGRIFSIRRQTTASGGPAVGLGFLMLWDMIEKGYHFISYLSIYKLPVSKDTHSLVVA
jgi:hypothetical protein